MKTFFHTLMLTLFATALLQAQDDGSKFNKFSFGFGVGIAGSTPVGKKPKGATGGLGLKSVAEAYGRYKLHPKVGLQLGMLYEWYSSTPAKYNTPVDVRVIKNYVQYATLPNGDTRELIIPETTLSDGNVRGELDFRYLKVPVLVHYHFSDRFRLGFGGYVARVISARHHAWATGTIGAQFAEVEDYFQDESAYIAKWDYGVNLSTNYAIFRSLECEFRAYSGVRSVFVDDYYGTDDTLVNLNMELRVNYNFTL